jgi:hypothetical protein
MSSSHDPSRLSVSAIFGVSKKPSTVKKTPSEPQHMMGDTVASHSQDTSPEVETHTAPTLSQSMTASIPSKKKKGVFGTKDKSPSRTPHTNESISPQETPSDTPTETPSITPRGPEKNAVVNDDPKKAKKDEKKREKERKEKEKKEKELQKKEEKEKKRTLRSVHLPCPHLQLISTFIIIFSF